MIPINCLSQALDRIARVGGYLMVRLSEHWRGLHVLWMRPDGCIEHFTPTEKLSSPWESLVGYEGAWVEGDNPETAKPIPVISLVLGAWVLAWGATFWGLSRVFRGKR